MVRAGLAEEAYGVEDHQILVEVCSSQAVKNLSSEGFYFTENLLCEYKFYEMKVEFMLCKLCQLIIYVMIQW